MESERIVNFFFELASLRRLTRSHRQFISGVNDNISDHSFRVAVIGMILARLEHADENKVLKMCLFHDLAEARTGDANFVNKQYLEISEREVTKDQMEGLPFGQEVIDLLDEYEKIKTKESIVAKDADKIDQMILQQEYFRNDEKNRMIWHKFNGSFIKTKSAKKLAKKIRETNPLEWLYKLAEDKTDLKVKR